MNMDELELAWASMAAGIEGQVPFLKDAPGTLYEQLQQLPLRVPSRVYLTGCGDSWYCGLSSRFAFEEWAGLATEAPQAMEFSRYLVRHAPGDALVVGISNSGRVSRTIEAIQRAKQRGLATLAGTGDRLSPIGRAADVVLDLAYAERRFAPGTSSYLASLVLLYCLALRLAELGGRLGPTEVRAKLTEMAALSDAMRRSIDAQKPLLEELGARVQLGDKVMFLGAGPNYGTAFFSMAKVIEAARHNAVGQELEEWAHEQYFVTDPSSFVFVLAPPGAGLDRAREQLRALRDIGAVGIAVCDADDDITAALAAVSLPVYGGPAETLSPLLYCVAGELFGYYFAVSKELTMLGFDDEQRKLVNFRQIFDSQIVRLE
ncbi:MAG: SIS domain-containing protein [Chloroflexi bacterium]|nr:MAG: SIS domain-containing protein [Chloroflexota bacterium]